MSTHVQTKEIIYPESDGKPIAENTKQSRWILTIYSGIAALFKDDPNVFVAGDLLWYPVEGNSNLRTAPDTMVVFGRPKGDRGSYLQWQEDNIPPQVVFEVLSPGNRPSEMNGKFQFYERYGVEEYYLYDPDHGTLEGWRRSEDSLEPIENMEGWLSPRLGVRFGLEDGELVLTRSDGRRFVSPEELEAFWERAEQRAEAERQRAESERQRAESERQRAERLAQRLRELGVEPDET